MVLPGKYGCGWLATRPADCLPLLALFTKCRDQGFPRPGCLAHHQRAHRTPATRHRHPPTNARFATRVPMRTVERLCMRFWVRGWKILQHHALSSFRGRAAEPGIHAVTVQGIDSAPLFTLHRHGMDPGSSLRSSGMTKWKGKCINVSCAAPALVRGAPLCPAGHLPREGGDFQAAPSRSFFQHCKQGRSVAAFDLPPLWGRWLASQRGYTGSEGDSDRHGSGAPPPPRSAGRDPVPLEDGARIGTGMEIVAKGRNDGGRGEICHRFRAGVVLMHPA